MQRLTNFYYRINEEGEVDFVKNKICNYELRDDISKKKSKKRDFGPFSLDPYPPTINRDILIRDIFDFIFPPTLLIKIGTFLKKKIVFQVHF